jgi:hypothetical protein
MTDFFDVDKSELSLLLWPQTSIHDHVKPANPVRTKCGARVSTKLTARAVAGVEEAGALQRR